MIPKPPKDPKAGDTSRWLQLVPAAIRWGAVLADYFLNNKNHD